VTKKKLGKLLVMPKPVEDEPQVLGFGIRIGDQRLKFEIKMTSQELRDGELVELGTQQASVEAVRREKKPAKGKTRK
jgi:hypothetical protein